MNKFKSGRTGVSVSDGLVRQVKDTLDFYSMLAPGQSVLIGFSGGADSTALLYALFALAGQNDWHLGIAHVHHGLREKNADLDADFTAALARSMDLPYYMVKADVRERSRREKISLEEAGRKARYAFFLDIAKTCGYDKIAVGHQKDDTAEQVMLNLLRGSGPEGLTGISPVRGRIIRPLIRVAHNEIETFLQEKHIAWREDDSNKDNRFTRNRIRNRLLPELQSYNPQISETLWRLANVMQAENNWLNEIVTPVFEQTVLEQGPGYVVLCAETLADQSRAAARRLVRLAIRQIKGSLRRIGWKHVEQILSAPEKGSTRNRQFHLPGRIRVFCDGKRLVLTREKKSLRSVSLSGRQYETNDFTYRLDAGELGSAGACIRIAETGAQIRFECITNDGDIRALKNNGKTARMDLDKVRFPLTIRNARPGDRFVPLGMQGRMKIKDFLINNKINRRERSRIPIVQSPEGIVWVGGLRIDESVKVTEQTTKILKIEISGEPATLQHLTDFRKEF
ncbi:MAG: tRNA lysidine(34) synthetase TilS [Desulfobacterales bacterium]|nr:tRNA lysidine(34) synthetase TilS [Desulfobacterales bacterium]